MSTTNRKMWASSEATRETSPSPSASPLRRVEARSAMVVVLLTLLLAACGGADADPATFEGPLVVDAEAPDNGLLLYAEIHRTVALVSDCVALTDPTGGAPLGVRWPPGSTWDEASDAVVLADGRRVRIGDTIKGGGGYFGSDDGQLVTARTRSMLDECGLDSIAFLNFDPTALEIDASH